MLLGDTQLAEFAVQVVLGEGQNVGVCHGVVTWIHLVHYGGGVVALVRQRKVVVVDQSGGMMMVVDAVHERRGVVVMDDGRVVSRVVMEDGGIMVQQTVNVVQRCAMMMQLGVVEIGGMLVFVDVLVLMHDVVVDLRLRVVQEMVRFVVHNLGHVVDGLHLVDGAVVDDLGGWCVVHVHRGGDGGCAIGVVMVNRVLFDKRPVGSVDHDGRRVTQVNAAVGVVHIAVVEVSMVKFAVVEVRMVKLAVVVPGMMQITIMRTIGEVLDFVCMMRKQTRFDGQSQCQDTDDSLHY